MKNEAVQELDEQVLQTKRTDIMLIDPRNIVVVDGFNVRKDYGDIESLSESILEIGMQTPIKAKKVRGTDKWELIEGHRRMSAINLLLERGENIPYVPAMPFQGNDEDKIFSMLATGVGAKELNAVEQAEGVKRLVNLHYSVEEIAKKIGRSIQHVYNLLTLSNAPKEVKGYIENEKVSTNVVMEILKKTDDGKEQTSLIKEAISNAEQRGSSKATTKDVNKVKKLTQTQKIKWLMNSQKDMATQNERVQEFLQILEKLKSIENEDDLMELFS